MSIFITQGRYTESAMKGMVDKPEDRLKAVEALMESVGVKLLNYYVTLGEYDFLVVTEGENLTDVVGALMVVGSTGTVTNLSTHQAMTTQEAKTAMEKANAVRAKFAPAGGG